MAYFHERIQSEVVHHGRECGHGLSEKPWESRGGSRGWKSSLKVYRRHSSDFVSKMP